MDEFSDTADVDAVETADAGTEVADVADDSGELAEDVASEAADTVDFDSLDVLGEDVWEGTSEAPADTLDLESLEVLGDDLPEDVDTGPSELDEMLAEYDRMKGADAASGEDGAPQKVLTR